MSHSGRREPTEAAALGRPSRQSRKKSRYTSENRSENQPHEGVYAQHNQARNQAIRIVLDICSSQGRLCLARTHSAQEQEFS